MLRRLRANEVRAAVVAVLVARTAVNGATRIVYPFLPAIARGLGVSLEVMGGLLALRAVAGLAAPLVPQLAERRGRRSAMLAGITATVIGCGLVAGAPGVVAVAVGFAFVGVSKPLFDIPMQGWFGSRVPYEQRGRVLGISELTWSVSLALAFPAGFLIAATSWRAPFVLIALIGLAGVLAVRVLFANDRPAQRRREPLTLTRPLVAVLVVGLLFRFAAETMFVVYGSWLEVDFGLSVAAIGAFTLVVVASELAGEGAVVAFADRLGLKRTILFGLVGSGVAYASLGLVDGSLGLAIVAVGGWFVLFEVTIVASIPFVTELAVEGRDRMLSLMVTVAVATSGLAALVAPRLFAAGGIALCGLVAAACVLTAAVILAGAVPSPAGATSEAPGSSRETQ